MWRLNLLLHVRTPETQDKHYSFHYATGAFLLHNQPLKNVSYNTVPGDATVRSESCFRT